MRLYDASGATLGEIEELRGERGRNNYPPRSVPKVFTMGPGGLLKPLP
jgi:hypothetical protein